MIAYLTGSGFYDYAGFKATSASNCFGKAELLRGSVGGRPILLLPRHASGHLNLPHHINHRANLLALKDAGATAVVSCSVCGVLNPEWPIGQALLANDVFFPDNRLGDGSTCSVFDTSGESGRGHLLAASLLNAALSESVAKSWGQAALSPRRGAYAHVLGPRFNTAVEIRQLRALGIDFLSQTCGPEAVLANELELPYALAAFGVDYANGVAEQPTPVETLNCNLAKAKEAFIQLIETLAEPETGFPFENFVYRF